MIWYLEGMSISEDMLQKIEIKHTVKSIKLGNNRIRSTKLFYCETLNELDLSSNQIEKI
jgi:Leucine-rich repeat (LRR) protein